ncbi:MAG: hypothetical protein EZS28_012759, partial [Streblomastix strix]
FCVQKKNEKYYVISRPRKNTSIAITPVNTTDSKQYISQLLGIGTTFKMEDIASQIDPDDEYKTLVVDFKSRATARLMKEYLSNKEEFKQKQKRVNWADSQLLCNCLHIIYDNRERKIKCDDKDFNEETVKEAFYQKFLTKVDRVELYFTADGTLKGDGLLFFENTLKGERTAMEAVKLPKNVRFLHVGEIRVSYEDKEDKGYL